MKRPIAVTLKAFALLLISLCSVTVLLLSPWAEESRLPVYRTGVVERGDLVVSVSAAGTLSAVVMVEVGSQVSGQINELYGDFNTPVTQGQLIARINPEIYEAKLAQAEAELEFAESLVPVQRMHIERARADLENAKALHSGAKATTVRMELALEDSKRELNRKRSLADQLIVSPAERDRVENAYQSAYAQLTSSRAQESAQLAGIGSSEAAFRIAEAQLQATLAQVKQRQAALRQAQIDLKHTYIRAPVTGTVVNRNVSRGQTVAASLQAPTLFTIAQDLTRMQVLASVVEADISRFAPGQGVTFSVDAYPGRSFTGEVVQIRKAPQVTQNVVTYIVVISADNPDEALLPGMTANLQVVVARKHDILLVPNAALRFRPQDWTEDERRAPISSASATPRKPGLAGAPGRVFVIGPNGRALAVPLRLGASDGRMTEVLAGELSEGRAVLTGAESSERARRPAGFRLL